MQINIYKSVGRLPLSRSGILRVATDILKDHSPKGEMSIHCIGDARMRTLNRLHRGKDYTTDVLSFSVQEGEYMGDSYDLGDVFINPRQIERQAKRFRISSGEEFTRILIHSILHLLGHDHVKKKDAKLMFSLQEYYVEKNT